MSGIIESTIESPFEFYNQILFYNGIKAIEESFYFQNTYTEGYKFYNEIGNFTGWIKTLPDSVKVLHLSTYFEKVLKLNSQKSLTLLDEGMESLVDDAKKDFIENQLNHIQSFLLKISKSKDVKYFAVVENTLLILVKDIFFKYNFLKIKHNLFSSLAKGNNPAITFFGCKEMYKRSFYNHLYDITLDLGLIEEYETTQNDFINVLTSQSPSLESNKIRFIKDNPIVAYYLRKLETYFHNLKFSSIEASQSFYNKRNKLFTANNLSRSFNNPNYKKSHEKFAIDEAFSTLEDI